MCQLPLVVGSCLALESEPRPCAGWRVCLEIPDLFVLETSQDPPGLAFLERTIFVSFDGENPAASYVVLNFAFSHVHQLKDVVFFRPLVNGVVVFFLTETTTAFPAFNF